MKKLMKIVSLVFISTMFFVNCIDHSREQREREKEILFRYKNISYEQGYKHLQEKCIEKYTNLNLTNRNSIICFWDSLVFDHFRSGTLKDLDSITNYFGRSTFNYIYATEMQEKIAKAYLERMGIKNTKFQVLGDMDDFISGVYNECKLERMMFLGNLNDYKSFHKIKLRKSKPFYMIIDTCGKILYYTNKYYLPSKDTAFLKVARNLIVRKSE